MWIFIPDSDSSKQPWVGQIKLGRGPKSAWEFEAVRLVDLADMYRENPFSQANNVIGLLDHQKPCTLIRPIVTRIDPGKLDVKNKSERTLIAGQFQALLSDIPASDGNEQKFLGLAFESEAFDAWYTNRSFDKAYDRETGTHKIDIKAPQTSDFKVDGLGAVSCTAYARLASQQRSSSVKSATLFRVQFEKAKLTCPRIFGPF